MRGKDERGTFVDVKEGITPACAGKSVFLLLLLNLQEDHPRMCGEKKAPRKPWLRTWGSPPHVRGKELVQRLRVFKSGITPACAGKSGFKIFSSRRKRDHPRMCGEKAGHPYRISSRIGSPPHVRGKASNTKPGMSETRITPACAGKRKRAR